MSTIEMDPATHTLPRHRTLPSLALPRGGPLHRPLLWMVAAMGLLVLFSAGGMLVDDRMLLGESVWLKPLKFGLAFVLYGLTLAWLLSFPHKGSRVTRWMGTIFAVTGFVDVGFVVVQAARGTFSHFNTESDPVNEIGQMVFMSGVPGLFLANLVIALIITWQKILDRPITMAIRAGLVIAVFGMALGYLMGSTGAQLVRDTDGRVVELAAGHTKVDGAAGSDPAARDGVGGMPITHWSTIGGDLRVPHFLGLHGIQLLLVTAFALAWLAPRFPWLRTERTRSAIIGVLGLGYLGLMVVTLWQALRAQSLIHPDAATLTALGGLLAAVVLLLATIRLAARTRIRRNQEPGTALLLPGTS